MIPAQVAVVLSSRLQLLKLLAVVVVVVVAVVAVVVCRDLCSCHHKFLAFGANQGAHEVT